MEKNFIRKKVWYCNDTLLTFTLFIILIPLTMFWFAFVTGFLGSLHCIGMCGAIVMALPKSGNNWAKWLIGRLLYNGGRITTYGILGVIVGILGHSIQIAGFQQWLSIVMGVGILIAVLFSYSLEQQVVKIPILDRFFFRLKQKLGKLLAINSQSSLYLIGLLNGLLPCGFVYLGLAGAMNSGCWECGGKYMLSFGLGTLPALLGFSFFIQFVPKNLFNSNTIFRVLLVVFACLLILRGLNLGIPFISPNMNAVTSGGVPHCH